MEYILKVSPKGQVTLPKKLREKLNVENIVEVEIRNNEGIFKKPDKTSEKLAGCFKNYSLKKKISIGKAIKKATEKVAHEIAGENN